MTTTFPPFNPTPRIYAPAGRGQLPECPRQGIHHRDIDVSAGPRDTAPLRRRCCTIAQWSASSVHTLCGQRIASTPHRRRMRCPSSPRPTREAHCHDAATTAERTEARHTVALSRDGSSFRSRATPRYRRGSRRWPPTPSVRQSAVVASSSSATAGAAISSSGEGSKR